MEFLQNKNLLLFLRVSAICSFLGALTTVLLIFLPSSPSSTFESSVLLINNNLYISKLWILFFHPQVNFIAALGIGLLLIKKYPLQIILGLLFLFIWTYTEMSQQALSIDALNQIWRPGYLKAENDSEKTVFLTLIKGANGLWDSQYFLIIYGFGLGSLFYGLAFIKENTLGRWIGLALVFIGILSLLSFFRYYLKLDFLSPLVDGIYTWIYPYLQPLVRIGMGIWIFNILKSN